MNERLERKLIQHAEWRRQRDGIGEFADYMRLHESQHPALISEHIIRAHVERVRAARKAQP